MRPVQWPRTSTCGFATAASIRSVISGAGMRSLVCTLATTTSSSASSSSLLVEAPVVEDVDLDAGQDAEAGVDERRVELGDVAELRAEPLRGQPVGDRQPRRVVGEHEVLVAELEGRLDHLLDRRAAVGPVRVGVAVAAQRGAQLGGGVGEHAALGGLQAAQVVRLLAGERLGDAARRHVPDPAQPAQLTGLRERGQLVGVAATQGGGGAAEGTDPVGGLVGPLEQERDPAQVGDGIAGSGHGPMVPRMRIRDPPCTDAELACSNAGLAYPDARLAGGQRGRRALTTFPMSLRGRASTNRTSRGRLCGASRVATCSVSAAPSVSPAATT